MKPSPLVSLGRDTSICSGISLTLSSSQPPGTIYDWSTGSNAPSIDVTHSGIYSLMVTLNGCSAADSVRITEILKPVINLGGRYLLCVQVMACR